MSILNRIIHPAHAPAEDQLTAMDYDAQADLALPTHGHELEPADVIAPFAGSLVPTETGPGYDVGRDTGL